MREIKFRGIEKNISHLNNYGLGFVYGSLNVRKDGCASILLADDHFVNVHPETIGQYTSMKDCNGTEIYDGDIVRTDDEDEELAIIEWGDDTLKFMVTHGNVCSDLGEYYPREIEVVGNIYDNPELIGGGEND